MTLFTLRINILLGVVEHEQKHFNGPLVNGDGGKKKKTPRNIKATPYRNFSCI
jgi:hypothetical protein